jgi:hypothetical protein
VAAVQYLVRIARNRRAAVVSSRHYNDQLHLLIRNGVESSQYTIYSISSEHFDPSGDLVFRHPPKALREHGPEDAAGGFERGLCFAVRLFAW